MHNFGSCGKDLIVVSIGPGNVALPLEWGRLSDARNPQ